MDNLIIIGGSPFVNTIDLCKLDYTKYDILAINVQPTGIPVKYLLGVDEINPMSAPKTTRILQTDGWKFNTNEYYNLENKELCFKYYSSSCAVLFAWLKGYKNVYLLGVDLIEDTKPFHHWHGKINTKSVCIDTLKLEKQYIYSFLKYINIYQSNPEVINQWNLPYFDVKDLLTK